MSENLIDHAAQVLCDASGEGTRWADHGEPFRDIYRRRAHALVAAGLLTDDRQISMIKAHYQHRCETLTTARDDRQDELDQMRENFTIASASADRRQDELEQLRENLAIVSALAVRNQERIDAVIRLLEQPGLSNLVEYQGFDGAYSQIRAALLDD